MVSQQSEQLRAASVWQSSIARQDVQSSMPCARREALWLRCLAVDATPGGNHAVPAVQAVVLLRLRKRHLLPLRRWLFQSCPTLMRALLHSMTLSVTGSSSILGAIRRLQPDCYRLLRTLIKTAAGFCALARALCFTQPMNLQIGEGLH